VYPRKSPDVARILLRQNRDPELPYYVLYTDLSLLQIHPNALLNVVFSGCMGDEKDKQRVSLEGEEKYNDALIAGSITGEFDISTTSRMKFIVCVCLCVPFERRH